jgi:hypothetical protein
MATITEIIVTKKSVSKVQEKLYSITANLICKEDSTEVINQDFSIKYRTGDDIEVKVALIETEMQKAINDYNEENTYFTAAQLDTAITNITNNLTP